MHPQEFLVYFYRKLSLVLIRRLRSLPVQGQYLSETRISFKGAYFSMVEESKEDQLMTSISI